MIIITWVYTNAIGMESFCEDVSLCTLYLLASWVIVTVGVNLHCFVPCGRCDAFVCEIVIFRGFCEKATIMSKSVQKDQSYNRF